MAARRKGKEKEAFLEENKAPNQPNSTTGPIRTTRSSTRKASASQRQQKPIQNTFIDFLNPKDYFSSTETTPNSSIQTSPTIQPTQTDPNLTPKPQKRLPIYLSPTGQGMETDSPPEILPLPPTLFLNQSFLGNQFDPKKKDQHSNSKTGNQGKSNSNPDINKTNMSKHVNDQSDLTTPPNHQTPSKTNQHLINQPPQYQFWIPFNQVKGES